MPDYKVLTSVLLLYIQVPGGKYESDTWLISYKLSVGRVGWVEGKIRVRIRPITFFRPGSRK
jgi:hypothetical protein